MGAVSKQLSITERRRIERWRHAKVPVDEVARVLKRCRLTTFCELKRNHFSDESMPKCDGYFGVAVQLSTADCRAKQRRLIKHPDLCKWNVEQLKSVWKPEQIGNRMIHERAPLRVCPSQGAPVSGAQLTWALLLGAICKSEPHYRGKLLDFASSGSAAISED